MTIPTIKHQELLTAIVSALDKATATAKEYDDLSGMHSQLAKLNAERQKTIGALADALANLYSIARPFMSDGGSRLACAMQEEYVAAMKLAGRDPKI